MKNIKLKYSKINDKVVYFFNKLFSFNKFKINKSSKISKFNKSLISLISIIFIYLFYLSIPSLYNKERLQKDITEKLLKEFKINISISSQINYSILPSPHILVENAKIFDDDEANPNELSQIKKLKIFISQRHFLNQDNLTIKEIVIDDANFQLKKKNLQFLNGFINKKFSDKPFKIKNTNIFYKNFNDETILIFSVSNLNLKYIEDKNINKIISNGKIFKVPFNLVWSKDFDESPKSNLLINLKTLKAEIRNESFLKEDKKYANNEINLFNSKLSSQYQVKKNEIIFVSKNSKINNKRLSYQGEIKFSPFDLILKIDLDYVDLDKLWESSYILREMLKTNLLFNKNLSANITLDIKNIIKNKIFNSIKLFSNFDNGKINFNSTYLISDKVGILSLTDSTLQMLDDELSFRGNFNFKIEKESGFYKSFQIPKNNRKDLENIYFEVEWNLFNDQFKFFDFKLNNKEENMSEGVKNILNEYNNNDNKIENWIDLKLFVNKIFSNY